MTDFRSVLVLGASGFIGQAVCRRLLADGHAVHGVARDIARAGTSLPQADWRRADIARLTRPEDWRELLDGIDTVVNCAGALQDGARDNVTAVQQDAMTALYMVAEAQGVRLIVQISARTDMGRGESAFLATKRAADEALAASPIASVILRPSLVVGRNAHGGTALIRGLAAFPLVTPIAHAGSPVQTVALADVAAAVSDALSGDIAPGSDLELAHPQTMTLGDLVARHRAWLGLPPALVIRVPALLVGLTARIADWLGRLGWRSPLRSTALSIMADGVTAKEPAERAFASLDETLRDNPAGAHDLWAARLWLLKFPLLATLSVFWLATGIIALINHNDSLAHLVAAGFTPRTATNILVATVALDFALGLGVAIERIARVALMAMIAVSLAYLAGGTALAPRLWIDPLGPYLKVLPQILLACAGLAILRER